MILFLDIILIICIFILILTTWGLLANQITYEQRKDIMPERNDKLFWEKMKLFQKVSYEQHLFKVMTFQNAKKLYDKEII